MLRNKLTIALLAGTALSLAGAAHAADVFGPPPVQAPYIPPPQVWSWTGIHFGLGVGGQFDFAESSAYVYDEATGYSGYTFADLGGESAFATIEFGADYQMQNVVLGVFANYDWHPTDGTAYHYADAYGYYVDNEVTWGDSWAIGGRLGILATPRTLVYGLGGYAAKEITAISATDIDGGSSLTAGGWQNGWVLGAGVETLLSQQLSLKGEYRYARYSGFSADTDIVGTAAGLDYHSVDVSDTNSHTVRAVLSLRWGG